MTVVSLMYMPIDSPKSSKPHMIPVTSPDFPDGRARKEESARG